jgi:hypothetical protein
VQLVSRSYLVPISTGGGRASGGIGRANVYRLATLPEMATLPELAALPVLVGNPATFGRNTLPKVADNPSRDTLEENPLTRAREETMPKVAELTLRSKGEQGRAVLRSEDSAALLAEFEQVFWPEYPLKVNEAAAAKAWPTARLKAELATILAGLKRYKAAKPDWQQWAHAATWLNAERWRDAPADVARPSSESEAERRRKHALWAIKANHHTTGPAEPTDAEVAALVREGAAELADAARFCHSTPARFAERWGIRRQGEIIMPLGKSA